MSASEGTPGSGVMAEAPMEARPRVLCVDDDPFIPASVGRVLRRSFDVVGAHSAAAGLTLVRQGPPFAVVISDYQMPGMDGATFLQQVRQLAPDTVRVLLTGRSDLAAAVAAVNQGQIYRFLAKPAAPEVLLPVITAAAEQYRLATAERELLEQTLHGSIKALISLLALVQPAALGRTGRLKRHVSAFADRLEIPDRWSVEIAALLSQVGCVTLPAATMDKLARGQGLTGEEVTLVARLPSLAETLIAGIPRLELVRAILRHQDTHFDGTASPHPRVSGESIPLGARVLKAVLDFDALETQGVSAAEALAVMEGRRGWYDPAVLAAGHDVWRRDAAPATAREVPLRDVQVGMIFATDLVAPDGMLLVARGQDVTPALVDRVRHDWNAWAATRRVAVTDRSAS
jgi:response regulator RpfG family c-di-GMP phosphodiesterase